MYGQRIRRWGLLLLALALITAPSLAALAQEGDGAEPEDVIYSLEWSTVDGGGGTSTGGAFALSGTAGQPDAGLLAGGAYTLAGGFWGGVHPAFLWQRIYLPLVMRR